MTDDTTNAADWSARVAARLVEAHTLNRERVRHLNRLAQGEERLSPDQRESLKRTERRSRQLLAEMTEGVAPRSQVVSMEQVSARREALPEALREAYELLFCRVYGSDPAVSIGDAGVDRTAGRRVVRTSTSQPEGAGGAASPSKSASQHRRNVIRDQQAYEQKRKIDRRLARIAKETREFVLGENSTPYSAKSCSRCGRIGEQEWGFCPWCGYEMVEATY